jgi:hypothetical protein
MRISGPKFLESGAAKRSKRVAIVLVVAAVIFPALIAYEVLIVREEMNDIAAFGLIFTIVIGLCAVYLLSGRRGFDYYLPLA